MKENKFELSTNLIYRSNQFFLKECLIKIVRLNIFFLTLSYIFHMFNYKIIIGWHPFFHTARTPPHVIFFISPHFYHFLSLTSTKHAIWRCRMKCLLRKVVNISILLTILQIAQCATKKTNTMYEWYIYGMNN